MSTNKRRSELTVTNSGGRFGALRFAAVLSLLASGCAERALDFAPRSGDGGAPDPAHADAAVSDLAHTIDLAVPRDLARPPDLTQPADLFVPPGFPAPHPPLPQEVNLGGPHLANPEITVVSFPGDPLAADIEALGATIGLSGYWKTTTSEYGVGAPIVRPPIHMVDPPGKNLDDADIATWLADQLDGKHPGFGMPHPNSLFVIVYPKGTRITLDGATSCTEFGGYHSGAPLPGGGSVAYAVMPRCPPYPGLTQLDGLTLATSHEIIEAATDPDPLNKPAWGLTDAANLGWSVVIGGELGDLCEYNPDWAVRPNDLAYTVQRTWSNAAAKANKDPCVPADPNQFYFNTAPVLTDTIKVQIDAMNWAPTKGMAILEGQKKTIELDLFSDGPTGDWQLSAMPSRLGASIFDFTFDKTSGKNGDKVHLTVAVSAGNPSGFDGFFILSTLGNVTRVWPVAVSEL